MSYIYIIKVLICEIFSGLNLLFYDKNRYNKIVLFELIYLFCYYLLEYSC